MCIRDRHKEGAASRSQGSGKDKSESGGGGHHCER